MTKKGIEGFFIKLFASELTARLRHDLSKYVRKSSHCKLRCVRVTKKKLIFGKSQALWQNFSKTLVQITNLRGLRLLILKPKYFTIKNFLRHWYAFESLRCFRNRSNLMRDLKPNFYIKSKFYFYSHSALKECTA